MSNISEKLQFPTPSRYSSSLFGIVQQQLHSANNPTVANLYFGPLNDIVFNFPGSSSNEFLIPSTCFFQAVVKVHHDGNAVTDAAENRYTGQSTTGLPFQGNT
jgi:hypothetical protein